MNVLPSEELYMNIDTMARLFKWWLHSFGISGMHFVDEIMKMKSEIFD